MSALLANVTGWPSYISTKPSPSLDASPWSSVGSLSLKYLIKDWRFGDGIFNFLKGFFLFVSPIPVSFLVC